MTADQRRRSQSILARLEDEARYSTQIARATPVIDVADFAVLLRADKLAAAALLATLDESKLLVQAIALASFVNEQYGFDGADLLTTEQVLANFQRGIATYRASRATVEPTPDQRPTTGFAAGRHELDDRTVEAAHHLASSDPALRSPRWQNALRRGLEHLLEEGVIDVRHDGAYLWHPDTPNGGAYAVTPEHCQCQAFANDAPCKHRGAAIIVSLYHEADARWTIRRAA